MNRSRSAPLLPVQTLVLLQRLQFLARFEANRLPRRNRYFSARPWIASDPGFSRPDIENPEPSELNPVSLAQSLFHRFKDRLDSHFRFSLGDPSAVHDLVDDV